MKIVETWGALYDYENSAWVKKKRIKFGIGFKKCQSRNQLNRVDSQAKIFFYLALTSTF